MAVIETSGHFDTDAVCRLLYEYERGYHQHSQHLAAIAAQSIMLIEDAARLYEENERLRNENTRLNAKMSTRLHGINATDVKRYREASDGLCMEECKRILVEQAREGENAKLRELAKLYADAVSLDCDICLYCDPDLCDTETVPMRDGCRLWEEMHELGVEVKQ